MFPPLLLVLYFASVWDYLFSKTSLNLSAFAFMFSSLSNFSSYLFSFSYSFSIDDFFAFLSHLLVSSSLSTPIYISSPFFMSSCSHFPFFLSFSLLDSFRHFSHNSLILLAFPYSINFYFFLISSFLPPSFPFSGLLLTYSFACFLSFPYFFIFFFSLRLFFDPLLPLRLFSLLLIFFSSVFLLLFS